MIFSFTDFTAEELGQYRVTESLHIAIGTSTTHLCTALSDDREILARGLEHVIPVFMFPEDIRRAIYTTNVIESVNSTFRHITNNRALFSKDKAVFKLLYLGLNNASKKWTMPIRNCKQALQQFANIFDGRVPIN